MNILEVKKLGKAYRQWGSEWRRVASWFMPSVLPRSEHWVLKEIDFSLIQGEAIGIIGQNGAGKSTLLKLITGTACPTHGQVRVQGRVAAILELGMGFNPDLSGRENAYHSAGLMGYSAAEIKSAMPDIEAFAEVGEYFDQPIRTYSSGMQMRVAFSVATAFRPDILIVDEALSVGDSYFQHKSFERIRQFKADGVSILFVTHSMADVRALCDRVILLDNGRMIKDGAPDEVIGYYNALIAEKENAKLNIEQRRAKNGWLLTKSGTRDARVKSAQLLDDTSDDELAIVYVSQAVKLRIEVSIHADLPKLVLGYAIRDKQGRVVWGTNTQHTQHVLTDLCAGEVVLFQVNFVCDLGPGSYSITTSLSNNDTHLEKNYEWTDNLFVFDVINVNKPTFIGVTWIDASTSVVRSMTYVQTGEDT